MLSADRDQRADAPLRRTLQLTRRQLLLLEACASWHARVHEDARQRREFAVVAEVLRAARCPVGVHGRSSRTLGASRSNRVEAGTWLRTSVDPAPALHEQAFLRLGWPLNVSGLPGARPGPQLVTLGIKDVVRVGW